MPSLRLLPLFALLLSGCGSDTCALPSTEEPEQTPSGSKTFDPSRTGVVAGQVLWADPLPTVPPLTYTIPRINEPGFETRTIANPNRPQINPTTKAIKEAVVYLRKIDTSATRPWDLPPVNVAIGNGQILIAQGTHLGRNGFVRRGDQVSVISSDSTFQILRGRGSGFFSLTLPSPDDPVAYTLKHPGRIELSSGTGLSWMRADLFVCEHPYYMLTDSAGRFRFDRVPAGSAELVVWLPNWESGRPIHEPESGIIARQTYAPAFERVTPLTIEIGHTAEVTVSLP